MNKIKKLVFVTLATLTFVGVSVSADAYTVERQILPKYNTFYYNNPKVIVSHESGNANNAGSNALRNEVAYMTRVWNESYGNTANAHYFVGEGGKVIQLLDERTVGFHAGTWANENGIGVELARTTDKAQFKKDYASYVNLQRNLAMKYNIPLDLDTPKYTGIKSHLWISNNIWGDHADPYGYLNSMGISKAQYATDLKNGINATQVKPSEPSVPQNKPKPQETTLKKGSKVEVKKAVQYDNGKSFYANGTYDVIQVSGMRVVIGKGNVVTASIHANNLKYASTPKPKPTPAKPKPSNDGWVTEKATFTPNTAIIVRHGASVTSQYSGTLFYGQSIDYNAYKVSGGYVWVRYESFTGTRYLPVRQVGQNPWGSFK